MHLDVHLAAQTCRVGGDGNVTKYESKALPPAVFKPLTFFFSGYILELLNRSAISLQETFTQTWGSLYSQNSQVFSDLYTDLRHYYRGSNVNLEEVLNEFWARLLEKLFYQANKQYFIGTPAFFQKLMG